MSVESGLNSYLSPYLSALTPAVPFHWGKVPEGLGEYVELSMVDSTQNYVDDNISDVRQLSVVTDNSMVRASLIEREIYDKLQRYKGVMGGVKVNSITFVRRVEIPDAINGEYIIAAEYRINYEGA